jgi:hypothetical protein
VVVPLELLNPREFAYQHLGLVDEDWEVLRADKIILALIFHRQQRHLIAGPLAYDTLFLV